MTRSRSAYDNGSWECHMFIKNRDHVALEKHLCLANFNTNIRFQNETLLTTAIKSGSSQIVKIILSHGADPNLKSTENGRNEPPLLTATRWKNLEIVKLLIEGGADVKLTAFYGQDAIFQSVVENAADILEYLLEKSCHKKHKHETRNCPFLTALKYADRFKGKKKCLLALIQHNYTCECLRPEHTLHLIFLNQDIKINLCGNRVISVLKCCNLDPSTFIVFSSLLTLTNLARETIRNSCELFSKDVQSFADSVLKLSLPTRMISFILYKNIEDMFVNLIKTSDPSNQLIDIYFIYF